LIPAWLHVLSIASLIVSAGSALLIAVDVARHPQRMWIMNIVWPVVALFGSFLAVWGYFAYGRLAARRQAEARENKGEDSHSTEETPFAVMVGKGAAHCGSGCTLGDIVAEWLAFLVPGIAVWFGWKTLFSEKMFAVWILDYIVAFGFGVAFQYFTIVPMRNLSPGRGLVEAVKADALSLTAWQVGMYGFMAIAQFVLFRGLIGVPLTVDSAEFWFMMQIAMIAGFATSYPVNWWLIKIGVKERM